MLRDWGILAPDAKGIYFLASTAWWRPIFYIINIWKETGWGTIIFLATLAGINPDPYAEDAFRNAACTVQYYYHCIDPEPC